MLTFSFSYRSNIELIDGEKPSDVRTESEFVDYLNSKEYEHEISQGMEKELVDEFSNVFKRMRIYDKRVKAYVTMNFGRGSLVATGIIILAVSKKIVPLI